DGSVPLSLRSLREQAVLRRPARTSRLAVDLHGARSAAPEAEGLIGGPGLDAHLRLGVCAWSARCDRAALERARPDDEGAIARLPAPAARRPRTRTADPGTRCAR